MNNRFAKIIELKSLNLQVLVLKKFDKLPAVRIETKCEGDHHIVSYLFGQESVRDDFFDSYNYSHAYNFIKEYAHFR